jgi:putative endonuclease
MNMLEKLKARFTGKEKPEHLRRGELGERAAKKHLQKLGLKFLTANFRSARGEIDLIFRDGDCLAFVEVKTRSSEDWTRPAAAVDARKRRLLSQTALDYLRLLKNPPVKIRAFSTSWRFCWRMAWKCAKSGICRTRSRCHTANAVGVVVPYRYG